MRSDEPQPLFRTPDDQLNAVEQYKLASHGLRGRLHDDFRNLAEQDVIDETEQLAKSHGIYLEYNRATTGREKDWMYMVRVSVPGGGVFTREHWRAFDELSERYASSPETGPSLRLTTRQNVQFHWVHKKDLVEIIRQIATTGFFTLNGCGDNVRNVMGCPLSRFSDIYDANAMARKFGQYFRLPAEPHIQVFEIDTSFLRTPDQHFEYGEKLLNRKFKIAFSAVHRNAESGRLEYDNCVELRTNEIGVAPVVNARTEKIDAFMVYIGGGQGEKNGKATFAALGKPFAVFAEPDLLKGLDAIVQVHKEWGDRKNRHWARMKYVIQAMGIPWYQEQVRALGANFDSPIPDFDPGPRMLHHGWTRQPSNNLWTYGAYIENGRINNSENGDLKKMVRHLIDKHPIQLMITPNQDLLFTDITDDLKPDFESEMARFGYGTRRGKTYSKLRVLSGACVGLYTCRLAYTESEQFEPQLIDQLEDLGYGDVAESIGITGCERQCFRPATKTIGWVGQGPDLYALKLGGSEDARHQGFWLVDQDRWYLRQVPRADVTTVTAALFDYYKAQRTSETEVMGACLRRLGSPTIVAYLKSNPKTAPLMQKTADAPYRPA